ncbi:hypothetical protein ACIQXW_11350 [Lysinibacillus sp. NPDC097162]|uniref:hypothetical protein n=1 Tax=Lysinibacillus sp. NPDC097162 TaxID=3364140 RepID=UPI00380B3E93
MNKEEKEELQYYHKTMDIFVEKLMEKKNKKNQLLWEKIDKKLLKHLTLPTGKFVEKINEMYSTHVVTKGAKKQYFVIGEYLRKDFFNKLEYDINKEIFFTVYMFDDDVPDKVGTGKVYLTESMYKNFLLENDHSSDMILKKLNLLLSSYTEATLQNSDDLFELF